MPTPVHATSVNIITGEIRCTCSSENAKKEKELVEKWIGDYEKDMNIKIGEKNKGGNMVDKKFTWLAPSCEPRRGPRLETGKEYSLADFEERVVAEWVRTGAAKYVKSIKGGSPKEE